MGEMGVGTVEEKWKNQLQFNFRLRSCKEYNRQMSWWWVSAGTIPGKEELE
jgi:hypothetical protein